MRIEVRYYTKSGNTKKLAEVIAAIAGVSAKTVNEPVDDETDILFLGSSVYGAGVDEEIKKFIGALNPKKVNRVVNFSTAALLPSTYKQVKSLVEKQGIKMETEEFHCRGSFGLLHKNKPDERDIQEVEKFAKRIMEDRA